VKDSVGEVQSVLVLGAGSDIAQATMRKLVAGRTRHVVLAGRHPGAYKEHADELLRAGADAVHVLAFDAQAPEEHAKVVAAAAGMVGDLDLVLIASGVLGDQDEFDEDPVAAAAAVTTNYTGAVSAGLAAAEQLKRQGHGELVVLSSVAGQRARKSNPVYGSSKAGMDAFFQGLGDRLDGSGVHVLIVRPGFVTTKMTAGVDPAPMSTTADAVAEAIVRALQSSADVVFVPSILRWVFVVFRHLPRPIWRRLPW